MLLFPAIATGLFDWMLALDIVLIAASFIPGVGVAALAAKVVITAVRVVSAVSKVAKAIKVAAKGVGQVIKTAAKASKAKAVKVAQKAKVAVKKVTSKKGRKSEWASDVMQHWDRGTFPNRLQSLKYHHAKHGKAGQSLKDYAR